AALSPRLDGPRAAARPALVARPVVRDRPRRPRPGRRGHRRHRLRARRARGAARPAASLGPGARGRGTGRHGPGGV
ncbi:MAG: hypothetical protein AVDCRST_MAG66-2705, partial [uncultured Pseudonocardia sp.]